MKNILFLEDEVIIALSARRSIEANCQATVHLAHNSTDALKIAREINIDLLIADVNLKEEVDGIDVATQLDALYKIPTIFLTSYSDELTLERASKLKSISYLVKPFREDDLIAQLKIARYQYERDHRAVSDLGQGYHYHHEERELERDGEHVALTAKEHQLFLLMVNAPGKVISFAHIDDRLWPAKYITPGTRRQLFYRLRGKLPDLELETINTTGYRLTL